MPKPDIYADAILDIAALVKDLHQELAPVRERLAQRRLSYDASLDWRVVDNVCQVLADAAKYLGQQSETLRKQG